MGRRKSLACARNQQVGWRRRRSTENRRVMDSAGGSTFRVFVLPCRYNSTIPLQYVNAKQIVLLFRVADPFGFRGSGFDFSYVPGQINSFDTTDAAFCISFRSLVIDACPSAHKTAKPRVAVLLISSSI